MANPNGEMQYRDNGFPFIGVKLGTNDGGEMQFWDNGVPYIPLFAPSTSLKTWDGLVMASVKTIEGLAIANVKTINGLQ